MVIAAILSLNKISAQEIHSDDYLLLVVNYEQGDQYGYVNLKGDTVIPFNTYQICYTDTFRTYAIVLSDKEGLIAIDRNEKKIYKVFPFDNGPDYPSEGLFRIIKNGKIGYANLQGEITIAPRYACAYPFKKGKAKVTFQCDSIIQDDHVTWESESWFYIDEKGRKLKNYLGQ